MIDWLLGINLYNVEIILGLAFLTIMGSLVFISYEVYKIREDEDKK